MLWHILLLYMPLGVFHLSNSLGMSILPRNEKKKTKKDKTVFNLCLINYDPFTSNQLSRALLVSAFSVSLLIKTSGLYIEFMNQDPPVLKPHFMI